MEKEKEDLNELFHHNSSDLANLLQNRELARMLKESKVEGTTRPYKYRLEEQRDMKTVIDGWTVTIKELQKERDHLSAILSLKKKLKQLLKVVKEKRSRRESHESPIQNQLEAIILLYNVCRASYHGGDFTGGNLRNLFDNEKRCSKNSKQN